MQFNFQDELSRTLQQLGLTTPEIFWTALRVRKLGAAAPGLAENIGALEELSKYAPIGDNKWRSPQNRRGDPPPDFLNYFPD